MVQLAVELKRVTRQFRGEKAVDCLSLTQEKGRILGLVGLPDAGKATLIHLVAGLDRPSAGHVQVLRGNPLAAPIRARIGFAPNPQLLDPSRTPKETLYRFSRLKGLSRKSSLQISEQLLDELQFGAEAECIVGELSESSQQLVCVGAVFIGEPELLLFDGILDDLDDASISMMEIILRRRAAQGDTIVIADHCLAELGAICDDIALLHQGSLLGKASPEDIRASVRGLLFKYLVQDSHSVPINWEGVETRSAGTTVEILADHDVAEQLALHFAGTSVAETQPTFEEACLWILRNPESIAARSKLWGLKNS